jgi:hypothetical protein
MQLVPLQRGGFGPLGGGFFFLRQHGAVRGQRRRLGGVCIQLTHSLKTHARCDPTLGTYTTRYKNKVKNWFQNNWLSKFRLITWTATPRERGATITPCGTPPSGRERRRFS